MIPVLHQHLDALQLPFIKAQYAALAQEAAQVSWTHVDYLGRLVEGEFLQRQQRTIQRRVRAARFPVLKTLEQFR
jgi:DNA replication protein DnaC